MTAQFAGSRSLDDRRRRRLAQESGEEIAPPATQKRSVPASSSKDADAPVRTPVATDVVADESLIPSRLWKVIVYGVAGLLALGGLIWVNLQESTLGGLERLLSPTQGNAFRFFSTASLMLVSQLSFTIWWYRSRSRKDFGGRYRIWAWAGSFWAITCVVAGLGLHEPLAKLTYEQWPIHSWRPELLYWFVPFSIGVLALHQLISLDMRHSRASRFLWNATLACGVGAAGLKLGLDLSLPGAVRNLAVSGSACLWHFLLSFTLLFHARFVVHVTNEAAPRRASRLARTKLVVLERTARLRAKFATIKSTGKSTDTKKVGTKTNKRTERRKLKEAARAKRQEAKELARMEKEEVIAQKKADRDATQAAKVAEKQKLAADKVALAEEKKAERERSRAEAIAQKQSVKEKQAETKKQKQPVKTPTKTSSPVPEAKTASGKKRKRVLGNNTRVDAPQATNPPHSERQSEPKKSPAKASSQSYDDHEDDDDDFSGMSKKERRSARKKQRQRDSN